MTEQLFKRMAILGLTGSGKSSLVAYFTHNRLIEVRPTSGMQVTRMIVGKEEFPVMLIDLGGGLAFQNTIWLEADFFDNVSALLYVVDSSAHENYESEQAAFSLVLQNQHLKGIPILIIANKVDLVQNQTTIATQVSLAMNLVEAKIEHPDREISLIPISLKTGMNVEQIAEWIYRVARK
ncbi:MAG TPA: ADP-ribosylation factor-like protein [Candidatus Hodarchaeales archaeon]|nr:ADP-ribosylation factor-like protein [Candidatus Hodarchaeales archaeon]